VQPGDFWASVGAGGVVWLMSVVKSVEADLRDLAKRDKQLAKSGLAASALALAGEMDDPGNSATSKAMCARALAETFDRLRALAPAAQEKDRIDELSARRSARRRRAPAS
jgi:hypothetical protein